jgi:acyl carrier protein/acyl-CoA synthetase (AMP-forming)/AMP-acid ligase II
MWDRTWLSKKNWWIEDFKTHFCFKTLWNTVVKQYANQTAYFYEKNTVSYQDIENHAVHYRQQFLDLPIVRINASDFDWFIQAIAAWTDNKPVIFFNADWKNTEPLRFQLMMSNPEHIHWQNKPHLILFTSGTTGIPKTIIRNTDFALYEAASYIEDVWAEQFEQAICLIKPWFGAMTKHCLGMLLAGIPQFFSAPKTELEKNQTLIYGTPSLIANYAILSTLNCQAISLTGESLNSIHIEAFKKLLNTSGFVLNSYGSSECGVIARRKINYAELHQLLGSGFQGEVLPGKEIQIDACGQLYVKTFQAPAFPTGDIAKYENQILHLIGRQSNKRKIRGIWFDTSPLLNLLANHPDIYHSELSTQQTKSEQLIVFISAKPNLIKQDLNDWLFKYLPTLKLLPQFILNHTQPTLGVTGKQRLPSSSITDESEFLDPISMMSEDIINFSKRIPLRNKYFDKTLEEQGYDSIDVVNLVLDLEKKVDSSFPVRTLLKTDTPRQIAELLNSNTQHFAFRKLSSQQSPKDKLIICLGSGIITARAQLSAVADILYTDIVSQQNTPFHFSALASQIIEQEMPFLATAKTVYLAGYSIHALLAIELSYQMEMRQIPIHGVFLLDPPNTKRTNYLKRKKYLYTLRLKLLKQPITRVRADWEKNHSYTLRKLAIANHTKRSLKTPSLTLFSSGLFSQNPWLTSSNQHQCIELNFKGHLELLNTAEGLHSWLPKLINLINS